MDLTHISSDLKLKTNFNAGATFGLRDINAITGIVDNSVTSLQALIFQNNKAELEDVDPTNFDNTGITSGYDNVAFVFDIKREYKYNLSSDITDHYVEDNVAIQDHIGLKPIILEVTGSIAEVNLYEEDRKVEGTFGQDNQFNSLDSFLYRMGSLTSFAPNIINQAADIYNTANFVYSTVNKMVNFDKRGTSRSGYDYTEKYNEEVIKATRQCDWVKWFTTQWWNRASFTIVTPYGVLTDMYIMDLSASQPENTRYVTNLNIKFKQIRKAKVITKGKKVSQKMEAQQTKQFDIGELDIGKTNYMAIHTALMQPPANAGLVTQVTASEFEAYSQEVAATMNVPAPQGVSTLQDTLLTKGSFGAQTVFKPLPVMPMAIGG